MDFSKIKAAAEGYRADMTKFLRELVAIPGESCGEEGHIRRIEAEMKKVGFDKVVIDPMGNVMGYMGAGKTLIGYDAHIDTVGVGNRDNWTFDPYEGFETDEEIGGRGTSDRADRRQHLPRPARQDGDPRRRQGRFMSRIRAGARR